MLDLTLPPGRVRLEGDGHGLRRVRWLVGDEAPEPASGPAPLALECARMALVAYEADPRRPLPALPLAEPGATPFQRRVWAAMRAIPPGRVWTYGQLARLLGTSPRAVGRAAGANPWPILIPCHRVVAGHGLGGYMGRGEPGLAVKRWLLRHEGVPIPDR